MKTNNQQVKTGAKVEAARVLFASVDENGSSSEIQKQIPTKSSLADDNDTRILKLNKIAAIEGRISKISVRWALKMLIDIEKKILQRKIALGKIGRIFNEKIKKINQNFMEEMFLAGADGEINLEELLKSSQRNSVKSSESRLSLIFKNRSSFGMDRNSSMGPDSLNRDLPFRHSLPRNEKSMKERMGSVSGMNPYDDHIWSSGFENLGGSSVTSDDIRFSNKTQQIDMKKEQKPTKIDRSKPRVVSSHVTKLEKLFSKKNEKISKEISKMVEIERRFSGIDGLINSYKKKSKSSAFSELKSLKEPISSLMSVRKYRHLEESITKFTEIINSVFASNYILVVDQTFYSLSQMKRQMNLIHKMVNEEKYLEDQIEIRQKLLNLISSGSEDKGEMLLPFLQEEITNKHVIRIFLLDHLLCKKVSHFELEELEDGFGSILKISNEMKLVEKGEKLLSSIFLRKTVSNVFRILKLACESKMGFEKGFYFVHRILKRSSTINYRAFFYNIQHLNTLQDLRRALENMTKISEKMQTDRSPESKDLNKENSSTQISANTIRYLFTSKYNLHRIQILKGLCSAIMSSKIEIDRVRYGSIITIYKIDKLARCIEKCVMIRSIPVLYELKQRIKNYAPQDLQNLSPPKDHMMKLVLLKVFETKLKAYFSKIQKSSLASNFRVLKGELLPTIYDHSPTEASPSLNHPRSSSALVRGPRYELKPIEIDRVSTTKHAQSRVNKTVVSQSEISELIPRKKVHLKKKYFCSNSEKHNPSSNSSIKEKVKEIDPFENNRAITSNKILEKRTIFKRKISELSSNIQKIFSEKLKKSDLTEEPEDIEQYLRRTAKFGIPMQENRFTLGKHSTTEESTGKNIKIISNHHSMHTVSKSVTYSSKPHNEQTQKKSSYPVFTDKIVSTAHKPSAIEQWKLDKGYFNSNNNPSSVFTKNTGKMRESHSFYESPDEYYTNKNHSSYKYSSTLGGRIDYEMPASFAANMNSTIRDEGAPLMSTERFLMISKISNIESSPIYKKTRREVELTDLLENQSRSNSKHAFQAKLPTKDSLLEAFREKLSESRNPYQNQFLKGGPADPNPKAR